MVLKYLTQITILRRTYVRNVLMKAFQYIDNFNPSNKQTLKTSVEYKTGNSKNFAIVKEVSTHREVSYEIIMNNF